MIRCSLIYMCNTHPLERIILHCGNAPYWARRNPSLLRRFACHCCMRIHYKRPNLSGCGKRLCHNPGGEPRFSHNRAPGFAILSTIGPLRPMFCAVSVNNNFFAQLSFNSDKINSSFTNAIYTFPFAFQSIHFPAALPCRRKKVY
jgi:hypothetical protein